MWTYPQHVDIHPAPVFGFPQRVDIPPPHVDFPQFVDILTVFGLFQNVWIFKEISLQLHHGYRDFLPHVELPQVYGHIPSARTSPQHLDLSQAFGYPPAIADILSMWTSPQHVDISPMS